MLAHFQASVRQALRRSAFGVAGGLFLLLGFGFLTAAAWLALALAHGALFASMILGLVFCGVGLICLAMAARKPPAPAPAPALPPTVVSQTNLLAAFMGGLRTGRAMARRPSRR
jgi:hypothetical protein